MAASARDGTAADGLGPAGRAVNRLAGGGPVCQQGGSMAVLRVARLGHPVLRRVAAPVPPEGLGAPEVRVSSRIVVYGVEANPRYPDAEPVPLTVLVNPEVTPLTEEEAEDWEGCLSLPDLRGRVPRRTRVRVAAWGRDGRRLAFTAEGFHARVVQHECDHLDGIVYVDRMRSLKTLAFVDELRRHPPI